MAYFHGNPPEDAPFYAAIELACVRSRYDIPGDTRAKLGAEPHVYTVGQAAELLVVSRKTLDNWTEMGLHARQLAQGAPWEVHVSDAERRRLAATEARLRKLPPGRRARSLPSPSTQFPISLSAVRGSDASHDSRHLDLTRIAIGRAQAQHALSAMLGSAGSAPDRWGRTRRPIEPQVIERFIACGDPHQGFARIYCDPCGHDFLLSYSCKTRYFYPSCHQKRVLPYGEWVEQKMLAPLAYRRSSALTAM
jgi:hypothetical protein